MWLATLIVSICKFAIAVSLALVAIAGCSLLPSLFHSYPGGQRNEGLGRARFKGATSAIGLRAAFGGEHGPAHPP